MIGGIKIVESLIDFSLFQPEFVDLSHVYLSYNTESVTEPLRLKTARPRTSGVPRPKTASTRKYF